MTMAIVKASWEHETTKCRRKHNVDCHKNIFALTTGSRSPRAWSWMRFLRKLLVNFLTNLILGATTTCTHNSFEAQHNNPKSYFNDDLLMTRKAAWKIPSSHPDEPNRACPKRPKILSSHSIRERYQIIEIQAVARSFNHPDTPD